MFQKSNCPRRIPRVLRTGHNLGKAWPLTNHADLISGHPSTATSNTISSSSSLLLVNHTSFLKLTQTMVLPLPHVHSPTSTPQLRDPQANNPSPPPVPRQHRLRPLRPHRRRRYHRLRPHRFYSLHRRRLHSRCSRTSRPPPFSITTMTITSSCTSAYLLHNPNSHLRHSTVSGPFVSAHVNPMASSLHCWLLSSLLEVAFREL